MNSHPRLGVTLSSASLLLPPVVLAALCFSFALATADTPLDAAARGAQAAKSRALGQPLRFTNPFLPAGSDSLFPKGGNVPDDPQGFDLGDALAYPGLGSITRYITAAGGYLPYTFTLLPLLGNQADNGTNLSPALPNLTPAGILNGQIPPDVGNFLRFNVGLSDFVGTQRLGTFRLGIVPAAQAGFRFAQDALPRAQLAGSYFTRIETIGARGPVVFSVVQGSVAIGSGAAQNQFNSLEEVGLTLAPDGVLLGRPTKKGDITFTAQAVDTNASGLAASRAGLGQSQTFTIPVELDLPLSSELLSVSCSLASNRGVDSFAYSGYLDTRGYTVSRLAGSPLELRIGGAVFRGSFNDKGQAIMLAGASGRPRNSTFSLKLSPSTGRFTVKLKGADLATKIGLPTQANATIDKTFQTLVLGLDIGPFRTCEVLKMGTRVAARGSLKMAYILGKHGFSRAGGCQILSVVGADSAPAADPAGDRWVVRCLTLPGQDNEAQTAASSSAPARSTAETRKSTPVFPAPIAPQIVLGGTSTTIQVGDYSQTVTLTKKPVLLLFKGKLTDAGFYKVSLDPAHFVLRLETNILSTGDTSIPAAITTKNPAIFPMGVSFTGFNGETGRIIAPNRRKWNQR